MRWMTWRAMSVLVGPGRCCSPRHRCRFTQDTRGKSALDDVASNSNTARHAIGCRFTQETRVQSALGMIWRATSARPDQPGHVARRRGWAAPVFDPGRPVGPGGGCSPHYRVPCKSRDEGSKCIGRCVGLYLPGPTLSLPPPTPPPSFILALISFPSGPTAFLSSDENFLDLIIPPPPPPAEPPEPERRGSSGSGSKRPNASRGAAPLPPPPRLSPPPFSSSSPSPPP